jgi:hypothetical protein
MIRGDDVRLVVVRGTVADRAAQLGEALSADPQT